MPNVLIINHMFPPFNGVGVIRVAKFVRYLPEFDWHPIVMTCRRPEVNQDALDYDMLNALPDDLEIHRVFCPSLYEVYRALGGQVKQGSFGLSGNRLSTWIRSLFVPDPYVGWYFTGVRKGMQIRQNHPIDLIYTTSPCETAHLIGYTLQAKLRCPWIADFRDPWIKRQHRPRRVGLQDRLEQRLQNRVLQKADRITVAWEGIGRGFEQEIPGIGKKIEVLTNGYDEADFDGIMPCKFDCFTILYTGALYKAYTPEPIFQALHQLLVNYPEWRGKWEFILLGRHDAYVQDLILSYGLEKHVKPIYQVPHRACLHYVAGADMLIFSVSDNVWVPSKIFEYLRAGRPILGVVDPEADVVRLANAVQPGICQASRNPDVLASWILEGMRNREGNAAHEKTEMLRLYERKFLTKRLARIFDGLLQHGVS